MTTEIKAVILVGDPRSLETRRRLLLARDYLDSPFLFLAGDVLCRPDQLVEVAERYEEEKFAYGVMSGASNHEPAPTHGLLTIKEGQVEDFVFPPTPNWAINQFREMQVSYCGQELFDLLANASDDTISSVIVRAVQEGREFLGSSYFGEWHHFAEPKDLRAGILWSRERMWSIPAPWYVLERN